MSTAATDGRRRRRVGARGGGAAAGAAAGVRAAGLCGRERRAGCRAARRAAGQSEAGRVLRVRRGGGGAGRHRGRAAARAGPRGTHLLSPHERAGRRQGGAARGGVCASLRQPLRLRLLPPPLLPPLLLLLLLLLPLPLSCYCRRRRRYCATHGYCHPLRTTHRHPRRTRDASTTASTASPSISPSRGESSTSRAARSSTGRLVAATMRWPGRTLGARSAL